MADNDSLLSQFTDVTGVNAERARFFLESSAWQLEVALASFYENDGDDPIVIDDDDDEPEEVPVSTPPAKASVTEPSKPVPKPVGARNTRFATLASLNQQAASGAGSDDEEEGQAFYAGGSTHSGQQVLGPSKKKDLVSEMFKSVQEHGAEVVDPRDPRPSRGQSSTFGGAGYRLGQTNNDTEVVGVAAPARGDSDTEVVLKLWKDGFSINDGTVRPYADPANREFLESVRRGEVPMELVRQARGGEVHLNMEDHRHEQHVPRKSKLTAFTGKGNLLGSPAPATVDLTPTVTVADREGNEAEARNNIPIDSTRPTTTLQIRLADGSRLIGRFNTSHTIADVRTYITTARPQYQDQNFALLTSFPSKELLDGDQTLDQAGVLNAALLQRLK